MQVQDLLFFLYNAITCSSHNCVTCSLVLYGTKVLLIHITQWGASAVPIPDLPVLVRGIIAFFHKNLIPKTSFFTNWCLGEKKIRIVLQKHAYALHVCELPEMSINVLSPFKYLYLKSRKHVQLRYEVCGYTTYVTFLVNRYSSSIFNFNVQFLWWYQFSYCYSSLLYTICISIGLFNIDKTTFKYCHNSGIIREYIIISAYRLYYL